MVQSARGTASCHSLWDLFFMQAVRKNIKRLSSFVMQDNACMSGDWITSEHVFVVCVIAVC